MKRDSLLEQTIRLTAASLIFTGERGNHVAMKIDAHHHLWEYDAMRHAWITEEMAVLKRDFLPEELVSECTLNGIDGTVVVQADQSENETLFLLEMAEQNQLIAGVVGWTDLCSPRLAERLRFFSRYEKLCGFRHVAQSEPDDRFLMRESFVRGVSSLREPDFTYDILIYPKQLPAALELVAALPEQKFVIDYIAKPDMKTNSSVAWAKHMRAIAQNPNVFCKISGLVTEADWRAWKTPDSLDRGFGFVAVLFPDVYSTQEHWKASVDSSRRAT
jgi:L-fuconolactonase